MKASVAWTLVQYLITSYLPRLGAPAFSPKSFLGTCKIKLHGVREHAGPWTQCDCLHLNYEEKWFQMVPPSDNYKTFV